ncbi:uncharacterized protein [Procambarus clarkii]|uniref:uncharacterized protein n=1 Tax=Procambarus clarkii TaxID=6728 RepID=UPI003743D710
MYVITVIIMVIYTDLCCGVSYSDLEAMDAACSPWDSCERGETTSFPPKWHNSNCFCDEMCAEYGDCCLDSLYYDVYSHKNNVNKYQCINVMQYGNIYMKGTCLQGWRDEEVTNLCLSGPPASSIERFDPLGNLPATSLDTSLTYTNYYCALCNNDAQTLFMWKPRWECENSSEYKRNLTNDYVMPRLVYRNRTLGMYFDTNGTLTFHTCSIYPEIPEELKNITRSCSQAIKTCEKEWKDNEVADLCQSYTAVVYSNAGTYRNPHCAKCNNVTQEQLACTSQDLENMNVNESFNPQPFAMLMDYTDASGSNVVGSTSTCKFSEMWDSHFEKCRIVLCRKRNHVFKFDKCVEDDSDSNDTVTTEPNTTPSPPTFVTMIKKNDFVYPHTFAILDDFDPSVSSILESAFTCQSSEIWDPHINKCRRVSCGELNYVFKDGQCVANTNDFNAALSSEPNIMPLTSGSPPSAKFLKCNKTFLSDDEFSLYENRTVYVEFYNRSYQEGEYEVAEGGVLVCLPQTPAGKFSPVMGWVSLAGLGLSCLCLLLHLAVFILVPELRNLSGKNLASLCLALLASYICFIINVFVNPSQKDCITLAAAMYYCFLSSFTWMSVLAFDIWYTFRRTKTDLRLISGKHWQRFLMYSLYSWLLPAVATIIVVTIDVQQPEGIPEALLPSFGKRWCWFGHRKALLIFFAIPIVAIIIVNCILFISTAKIITETTQSTSTMTTSPHHKNQYKMYMRLAVLMGFTWISGLVAGYLQLEAVWYVFVVLNTLQGVFIFLAFTCRSKVWRAVRSSCRHLVQCGASWVAGRGRSGSPAVELTDTPDHQSSSSSPNTTIDGC